MVALTVYFFISCCVFLNLCSQYKDYKNNIEPAILWPVFVLMLIINLFDRK
jgi:hypothetical protein